MKGGVVADENMREYVKGITIGIFFSVAQPNDATNLNWPAQLRGYWPRLDKIVSRT